MIYRTFAIEQTEIQDATLLGKANASKIKNDIFNPIKKYLKLSWRKKNRLNII
jgi:hypothetical protein